MTADLVVRSERVVTPSGVRPAALHIHRGRIETVAAFDDVPAEAQLRDAGTLVIMPGVVDTHVHVNEPGRTEWEGFATATRAAAAGGVTTIVDMPLNSVPATTTVAALEAKRAAARHRISVDVAFWGGVVPGNTGELQGLCDAGVRGFKCFLVPSGVDEFPAVDEDDLRAALPVLAERGVPLLAHAELPGPIAAAAASAIGRDPRDHRTWLETRPAEAELGAIELLIRLAREFGARIHIVHVATAEAIPLLRSAREEGLRVTAETCPHYLTFAAEDVPDGATEFKCAPPIRGRGNREALWQAVRDDDLDLVATDHSPCPPSMKCRGSGDFLKAWGGVASLQLGLSATWTGLSARGGTLERLVDLLSAAPAHLAGLQPRKGVLAAGADADLVIWDPDGTFAVDGDRLHHRHKLTPYHGVTLRGTVAATFVRGQLVFDSDGIREGGGELL